MIPTQHDLANDILLLLYLLRLTTVRVGFLLISVGTLIDSSFTFHLVVDALQSPFRLTSGEVSQVKVALCVLKQPAIIRRCISPDGL